MLNKILDSVNRKIKTSICGHRDFRTNRRIIVFESDDWGSIRMSNKKAWDELLKMGYAVDKRPYERFDVLESPEDMEALFEVLSKYKDSNGNHPVITANMLMVNPDFERIEKSGYNNYFYEPIVETYNRYFGDAKVLDMMHQGVGEGVFMPQFHGREHFNVAEWMQGLQDGDEDLLTAFKYSMCGIAPKANPEQGNNMMVALRARNEEEQRQIDAIVDEGLQMFENTWDFKSKTFVAPCYCWSEKTEQVLANDGVELIQTSRVKKQAFNTPSKYYYSGMRNNYNQVFSIRNCFFEPATIPGCTIDVLMKQVDNVFANRKIVVFSTHRINFVGGIHEYNRKNNLALFDLFLKTLQKQYPDIEFMSSDKLVPIFE